MTGLDKILNQIEQEASSVAQQKVKAANIQAESIQAEAKAEVVRQEKLIQEKSQTECQNYRERIKSRAEFQKRTKILEAKQEIISDIIEKAYQMMCAASDEQYFAYVERMLEAFALPQPGEIQFCTKDLDRMPFSFKAKIKMIAMKKGGSLKLSDEPAQIESGFLLIYGGVEENCTFRALFNEKREQLQDKVRDFLFSR